MIGVENKSASPMYVAGVMIPAGETRHFEDAALPPEYRAAPAGEVVPPAPADPLAVILAGSVREIVAGADALSDAEIDALIEREEQAAKPRKTLLAELAEVQLERASKRAEPGAEDTAEQPQPEPEPGAEGAAPQPAEGEGA